MTKHTDGGAERFRDRKKRDEQYAAQLPGEDETPLPEPVEPIRSDGKVGRNDPCPCNSGKKYKQCCGKS